MRPPPHGSPTLVLVPSELEQRLLDDGWPAGLALRVLCGFGPVAAAARTAQLVERLRPARVLLIGIAGTYAPERAAVGSALEFGAVAIEGIGAGEGERAIGPAGLGFPQWPARAATGTPAIEERLSLRSTAGARELLLTTCAASGSQAHARERRRRFPDAAAEDMEGFGVALACALSGTPLAIVRGISNVAGERDPARWRIPAALRAARELAIERLLRVEPAAP
jgi:futalosine hydrolase